MYCFSEIHGLSTSKQLPLNYYLPETKSTTCGRGQLTNFCFNSAAQYSGIT